MEPIMKLEVVTPEENMGDVIGDLNKRRGQVEGMESSRSGARIVKAMVPLAEMFGYVTRCVPSLRVVQPLQWYTLTMHRFQLYRQGGIGRSERSCRLALNNKLKKSVG